MTQQDKQEPVFDLIKNMSKAEKRNFKLYATRLDGNHEAKFLALFDYLDSVEEYDEQKVLAHCPVKKQQLPNMKAHLYKQILTSIRLLNVQHSDTMQLREQLDFAQILYDKGLYRQSEKILDKVSSHADALEEYSIKLDVVNFQGRLATLSMPREMAVASDTASRQVGELCRQIEANSELSNTSTRAYSLYQQLGYARSQKDLDLINQYFTPRLAVYADRICQMSFHEKFYYYQAQAWCSYIRHDFVNSYRYGRKWVGMFDDHPRMKRVMYDDYMRGCSQILEGLYLMRRHRHFVDYLDSFEREFADLGSLNTNAYIIGKRLLYTNKVHRYFIEGEFARGLQLVPEIERFMEKYDRHLDIHYKMLMYYKIACLYFGEGNYIKCIEYLGLITTTKDHRIRRDLQCFARILNLIASYEAGMDYNLDYQIRSVYSFLVKMGDLQAVQKEMLAFLKKLNSMYADEWREELRMLYERLQPYENHPYERRAFYYLDILSWLESKITGKTIGEIIRRKFRELVRE